MQIPLAETIITVPDHLQRSPRLKGEQDIAIAT
jgi:hypothetical protein